MKERVLRSLDLYKMCETRFHDEVAEFGSALIFSPSNFISLETACVSMKLFTVQVYPWSSMAFYERMFKCVNEF